MEVSVVAGQTYVKGGPTNMHDDTWDLVSSLYGPRPSFTITLPDGTTYTTRPFHYGVDIVAPVGNSLFCLADGMVDISDHINDSGSGIWSRVKHDDGTYTRYLHQQGPVLPVGSRVKRGAILGFVGLTGLTTGAHVHVEWWKGGSQQDLFSSEGLAWANSQAVDGTPQGMSDVDLAIFEGRGYHVEEHLSYKDVYWLVVRA